MSGVAALLLVLFALLLPLFLHFIPFGGEISFDLSKAGRQANAVRSPIMVGRVVDLTEVVCEGRRSGAEFELAVTCAGQRERKVPTAACDDGIPSDMGLYVKVKAGLQKCNLVLDVHHVGSGPRVKVIAKTRLHPSADYIVGVPLVYTVVSAPLCLMVVLIAFVRARRRRLSSEHEASYSHDDS